MSSLILIKCSHQRYSIKIVLKRFAIFTVNADLRPQLYSREAPIKEFSCDNIEFLKNSYFGEHPRTAAFVRTLLILAMKKLHFAY